MKDVFGLVLLASMACSQSPTGSGGGNNQPQPQPITLTGSVQDSIANHPVAGASVSIVNGPQTTTDATGLYVLTVLPGTHSFSVQAQGYEVITVEETFTQSTSRTWQPNRLAPAVRNYSVNNNILSATIIDYQTPIDLGNNSSVRASGPGFTNLVFAGPWGRQDGGPGVTLVTVDVTWPGTTTATWSVADTDGNRGIFQCTSSGCTEQ